MSAYTDFLADPQAIHVWLADLTPLDPDTEAEVTLRVSTGQYATEPSDSPANIPYEARLLEGPSFETDAAPVGTLGQLPARRGGELRVGQRFGDLDAWRDYLWDGRRCVVRHGGYSPKMGRSLTYAEMGTSEHEIEDAKVGLDVVTIQLRDPARRFEDLLQTRRYMGTDSTLRFASGANYVQFGTTAGPASKANLTGDLTIEGRIWLDSIGANMPVLTWQTASPYPFSVSFLTPNGKLRLNASTYAAPVDSALTISTKRWYHFQVIRAGTSITFRVLEEATGTETIETGTASSATGGSAAGSLQIGSITNPVIGILDELRLWNVARTEAQWRDFRGRELTAAEAASSALILYCRMNDGTGTTVTDSSGSPANGTLTGAGTWLPSLQGKADLAGKVLPDGYGLVEDANPILVYETTRIYQVHSRNVSGSFTVSEGAATITAGTAYTDWLAFLLATTTAGQVDTLNCTDGTFIRLGSSPTKPISVTFQGDATGSGYVSTAADIVRRIITTRGKTPLADPGDLNTTSYSDLNTANSSVINLYFTEEVQIAEAIRRALGSVGAVAWFRRSDRKHTVKRFAGASGSSVVTLTERQIISIEPVDVERPAFEEVAQYRRNYSPLSVDQMAAGVITTARQAFIEKAFREIRRVNSSTQRMHKYSRTDRVETYLTTEAAAITEADRRLALFDNLPRAFRIECSAVGLQLDRMDIVTLDVKDIALSGVEQTRLSLSAVDFVVLAVGERSAERKATLTVWRED